MKTTKHITASDLQALTFGVYEALAAAAEEHDRDEFEIISPATVAGVEHHDDGTIIIQTTNGQRVRVAVTAI